MTNWAFVLALFASSVVFFASGVLAVLARRTLFSNRATDDLAGVDPYETSGDAVDTPGLWTLDTWPSFRNATAPYCVLAVSLLPLALSIYMMLDGLTSQG